MIHRSYRLDLRCTIDLQTGTLSGWETTHHMGGEEVLAFFPLTYENFIMAPWHGALLFPEEEIALGTAAYVSSRLGIERQGVPCHPLVRTRFAGTSADLSTRWWEQDRAEEERGGSWFGKRGCRSRRDDGSRNPKEATTN